MEFFERAHVAKSKDLHRKDSKTGENMKKKLKQMLHGFKQSDNELIKQSADMKTDFEDSSSVSGFSDLSITNSSIDLETTQGTVSPSGNEVSLSDMNDLSLDKQLKNVIEDDNDTSLSVESISDTKDDVESLSDDVNIGVSSELSSNDSNEATINSSSIETSTDIDSNDSDSFDADGNLAAKILEKLGKTKKVKDDNSKKRKLDEVDSKDSSVASDDIEFKGPFLSKVVDKGTKNKQKVKLHRDNEEYIGPYRPVLVSDQSEQEDSIISVDIASDKNSKIESVELSSPFVSVSATDMQSQSLSDILGDYRHPTIRNIPSESINYIENSSGLFVTEDVKVDDLQLEDDVNSLIPEIDDTIDDLDIDAIELDESSQPIDESMACDDTLQSEQFSERERSAESISPTLVNPVKVYYGKNNCIFILKHPAELYIHGKVRVQCLGGTVEVFGYTLQDQPCEVYAPNYNHALYIKTVENHNVYYGLFGKLTSGGLTVSEAEEIVTTLGHYDVVVSLQPLNSTKMDYVDNNFNVTDLFSKLNKNIDNSFKKASDLLGCSLYLMKPWKCFEEIASWRQAIKCGLSTY